MKNILFEPNEREEPNIFSFFSQKKEIFLILTLHVLVINSVDKIKRTGPEKHFRLIIIVFYCSLHFGWFSMDINDFLESFVKGTDAPKTKTIPTTTSTIPTTTTTEATPAPTVEPAFFSEQYWSQAWLEHRDAGSV